MKKQHIMICWLLMITVCSGAEVFLKSESTGRLYGPFEMKDGEIVKIGKSAFVVVEKDTLPPLAKAVTLEDKLKALRLPHVDFRMASTEDCVRFIQDQVALIQPDLALRIVVKRPKSFRVIDASRMDPFETASRASHETPSGVTLNEKYGSVYGVLNEVAEQSGFQIRYSNRQVTLLK